jgi:hypothetical protein
LNIYVWTVVIVTIRCPEWSGIKYIWTRSPFYQNMVNLKNGVFWDVSPFGSCKNRRFGET